MFGRGSRHKVVSGPLKYRYGLWNRWARPRLMVMLKEGRTHTGRIEEGRRKYVNSINSWNVSRDFGDLLIFLRNKIRLCGSINCSHVLNPTKIKISNFICLHTEVKFISTFHWPTVMHYPMYTRSHITDSSKALLVIIWCISENLQLNRTPWRWRRRTPKRVGAINNMRSSIQRIVNKYWSIKLIWTWRTVCTTLRY